MKKAISLIFLLCCLLFIVQCISTFFKDGHEVTYKIINGDSSFTVYEKYDDTDTYDFKIDYQGYSFFYNTNNSYNKQKNIITKIESYQNDNTICVLPILMDDKVLEIECSINNTLYSYESIKDYTNIKDFVNTLKNGNYSSLAWENGSIIETEYDTTTIYNDNILEEDTVVVWKYKGIDLISKNKQKYVSLYSNDKYENTHGTLVGKYYVAPNYYNTSVYDFNKLFIIDVESSSKKEITLNNILKQDTYINGIVDNKLYYFDPDNLIQYEVNPKDKKATVFGDSGKSAQYYNGKWQTLNVYDFVNEKKKFNVEIPNELNGYNIINIYESACNYYFITSDNSFYRVSKNYLDSPILLWQKAGLKEIKIVDDTVYYLIDDTLYYYNNYAGTRQIMKNNEWNYNYSNIYDIYKK